MHVPSYLRYVLFIHVHTYMYLRYTSLNIKHVYMYHRHGSINSKFHEVCLLFDVHAIELDVPVEIIFLGLLFFSVASVRPLLGAGAVVVQEMIHVIFW